MSPSASTLHPDRLFAADPTLRAISRRLYGQIAELPLISAHTHVPARLFVDDLAFPDPAALLVTPDHYLTRVMYSAGISLDALGVARVGQPASASPREIWRTVCANWHLLHGTATQLWLTHELVELFGVDARPSADTADAIYDQIQSVLDTPAFRPRALWDAFRLEVLATTDASTGNLEDHQRLRDDPTWTGRIIPTFRPDDACDPDAPDFSANIDRLGELTGCDTSGFAGYRQALVLRRQDFVAAGATCSDHGVPTAQTRPVAGGDLEALYGRVREPSVSASDSEAFRAHMLFESARMSCEDGLVMQLHPGVVRNHDQGLFERYGPDVGGDIPQATEYTHALAPLLNAFGSSAGFRVVVFTVDEDSFSRELAPLAGVYPALRIGAPWWFLDAPHAILRWREAVTETAGFYNTAGFVDDTRAFCSIPARHDMARRLDCVYLARLVAEHRLTEDEAATVAVDLTVRIPKETFGV